MVIKGISGGWNPYLFFGPESTWGTAVTADIYVPYASYDVKAEPEFYTSDNFTGVRQRKANNEVLKTFLRGSMACDMLGYQVNSGALKSIAQHLIDAAVSAPADEDLSSHTFSWFDPNEGDGDDSKVHDGMRVNQMTIAGDEASGAVRLGLAFEGQQETVDTKIALPDATRRRPMLYRDCTFKFGGVTTVLKSFSLTLDNGLIVRHNNSQWPSSIVAGPRVVGYSFGLDKLDAVYDVLRRGTTLTDQTAEIVCRGNHQGTGANTNTVMTIAVDLMQFGGVTDLIARADIWGQDVTYVVIKPDTTSNDIDITWSVE